MLDSKFILDRYPVNNRVYEYIMIEEGFGVNKIIDESLKLNNRLKKVIEEELKAIKHWIKNTTEEKLAKNAIEVLDSKGDEVLTMVANNAFMLKELKEEGIKEGKKEGKKEGEKEGKEEKQIEIARNLLDVLEDEIIAKKTGLKIEEVIKLRKEYLDK